MFEPKEESAEGQGPQIDRSLYDLLSQHGPRSPKRQEILREHAQRNASGPVAG